MKLLTVTVPCYNSQSYMQKCIDSLLIGGNRVEIILVNDGSTDGTAALADKNAKEHPDIIRVIHKENGGHGSGVNIGLANATGLYFKVVDSDDWVDAAAYLKILDTLEQMSKENSNIDLMISNYMYENENNKRRKGMHYQRLLPENQIFTWKETKHFGKGHYMLMHALIYRTGLLRDCNLVLPEHTFYVDNLYAYVPLPYVKTMYYLNVDFYRYFIGRVDQSVNKQVMLKRIDQQIRVNKMMIVSTDLQKMEDKHLQAYMLHYLELITAVTSYLLVCDEKKEHLLEREAFWQYVKEENKWLYHHLRSSIMNVATNLPGKSGHKLSIAAYKIAHKFSGFE
ncbi:MAG: glycosyltransferase family 2 protein [Lachnospiraceae bacterium]|nr:glycosyltransferase family 2 protein [Lachnospiraceae bacterium]